jgi:hypothetical protein
VGSLLADSRARAVARVDDGVIWERVEDLARNASEERVKFVLVAPRVSDTTGEDSIYSVV